MTYDEIKRGLQSTFDSLKELEARARKLQNQNLADIAASAHGRVRQLMDHPDTELVGSDTKDRPRPVDNTTYIDHAPGGVREAMPFDPKAGAPDYKATFPPQGVHTVYGTPDGAAPGSEIGGPDRGKDGVHVPGEPRFDQPNKNFQQPNAVDLNPDGTLRQAPNSVGAQPDVREGA